MDQDTTIISNADESPKDEQITNQDTSVTNADPDTDTQKGSQPNEQDKPDDVRIPTVTPDNDSGDPGPPSEQPAVDKGEITPAGSAS